MKLAIITALHERYRLTRLFLDYYQRLNVEGVDLGLFCTCTTSEYKMRDLVAEYPLWNASTADNSPLTRKFAASMPPAKEWGADAVMILGSDDFVNADYVRRMLDVPGHVGFVGNRRVHYIDLGTDQLISQWDMAGRPIGAGRVLFRSVLDRMDWHPWLDDETTGLDKSMLLALNAINCAKIVKDHPALLDCKERNDCGHSANNTPWETVRRWPHESIVADRYLTEHFPELKQTLLTW